MKKTSLLLGTLILQLTVSYAQQTQLPERALRAKAQLGARLNDILKANNVMRLRDDETPLAQSRRIVKQEYFGAIDEPVAEMFVNYGYTSTNKGQEFHPSMIVGFPMQISTAGKTDRVFYFGDLFSAWAPYTQYNFPMHELGTEIVIDTLGIYEEGNLVQSYTLQRGANNRIDTITKVENYTGGQEITKTEKFYTNNLLTKIEEYYGQNLSTMELESRRLITYDNNQKVIADTLFYYYQGAIDEMLTFDYSYNTNGDVSAISLSSDFGDSAHVTVDYYTDGRFKNYQFAFYSGGDLDGVMTDSIAYATNGFIAKRKMGSGYNDTSGNLIFEYNIMDLVYNGNLLDTVNVSTIDATGQTSDGGFAKYHYSNDSNPDSLMIYYDAGTPAEEKMIFHYEPYNTTSVKQITRNNNFNIYPNPIGSTMNIYNKVSLKDRKATIRITDIKGSRIWSTEQALMQGVNQVNIPASLSAGVYLISITADNSVYTQKVIKQ